MGNKPNVPAVPSATQVSADQTQANVAAQAGSMVNQENPYGSLNYTQTGTGPNGVPIYTSKINLSPEQQQLYDTLVGTQQSAGTAGGKLIGGANYGDQSPADVIGGMTSGTTKDLLDKETGYLNPFFTTSRDQLDTKLRNQGLAPGTPGYDNAMRSLDTSQGLTVSNFLASAEPQAYSQAKSTYEEPATLGATLAALGTPGSPNSDFVNAPQLQATNVVGANANQSQAQMAAYNAQNQQYQQMLSGAFGVPSAVLGGWASSPTGGAALSGLGTAALGLI